MVGGVSLLYVRVDVFLPFTNLPCLCVHLYMSMNAKIPSSTPEGKNYKP